MLKSWSLIFLLLVLAGCSDGGSAAPTPSTPPKVTHSVAVNKDRDADAAVAALSKIGPCKLLDPARAKAPGVPVTTRQVDRSATECYVGELRIDVAYKSFRYLYRWQHDRVALAGAAAYLQTDNVFVLCTGIPEDQALVPAGTPSATTSGRNVIVLETIAKELTRSLA